MLLQAPLIVTHLIFLLVGGGDLIIGSYDNRRTPASAILDMSFVTWPGMPNLYPSKANFMLGAVFSQVGKTFFRRFLMNKAKHHGVAAFFAGQETKISKETIILSNSLSNSNLQNLFFSQKSVICNIFQIEV